MTKLQQVDSQSFREGYIPATPTSMRQMARSVRSAWRVSARTTNLCLCHLACAGPRAGWDSRRRYCPARGRCRRTGKCWPAHRHRGRHIGRRQRRSRGDRFGQRPLSRSTGRGEHGGSVAATTQRPRYFCHCTKRTSHRAECPPGCHNAAPYATATERTACTTTARSQAGPRHCWRRRLCQAPLPCPGGGCEAAVRCPCGDGARDPPPSNRRPNQGGGGGTGQGGTGLVATTRGGPLENRRRAPPQPHVRLGARRADAAGEAAAVTAAASGAGSSDGRASRGRGFSACAAPADDVPPRRASCRR